MVGIATGEGIPKAPQMLPAWYLKIARIQSSPALRQMRESLFLGPLSWR